MLPWTIAFLIIAVIAAFLGFGGMAGEFVWLAKTLFFVFLIFAVLGFQGGASRRRSFWG